MFTRIQKVLSSRVLGAALALGLLHGGSALAQDRHAAPHAAPAVHAPAAQPGPKVVSVQDAAKMAGRRIFYGTLASTPQELAKEIRNVAVKGDKKVDGFYMATMMPQEHFEPNDKYHHNLFFVSATSRDAATNGSATRIRDNLHSLGERIEKGEFDFDTVVVRVSPPNAEGLVSLGTTGDLTMLAVKQVLARGGKVIAQVNPNVPFTRGSNTIAYKQLHAVVESNEPVPAQMQAPVTVVERTIADNVANLVPKSRRSTLQVGIGAALSDIGRAMKDKKLRIWSEMGSDWLIDTLAQEHNPAAREATVSFIHGSPLLYQVAHDNPALKIESSNTVNDPKVVAQQKRMVAVNTALEVDLTGNTNGEELEGRVVSAPGGQVNFMEGASLAPDGKAVLALRSINKFGGSTIVPKLSSKNVTTPSHFVDHIVTEWGASDRLRGMADGDRIYSILSVTHPFHREALGKEALAQGKITEKQFGKLVKSVHPTLLRAPVGTRTALANAALQGQLITPEQHREILASVPPGTPAELIQIPAIPARN
jgi:4-hydroxybutyrate CoA-transferase